MKHRLVAMAFASLTLFGGACSRRENAPPSSAEHNPASTGGSGNSGPSGGASAPVQCGSTTCAAGQECCNASCGICTEPGGACTQEMCGPSADAATANSGTATCSSDADCRTFSDYCTGCDCRVLARGTPDPRCSGPGVRCLADPCMRHTAACDPATHACVLR